jgi:hypothetical protein
MSVCDPRRTSNGASESTRAAFHRGLGHFLRRFRFWRSYHAGPNPGPRSTLKPNPAQARVLFAHALVGSFAGPREAFFSPFPIIGDCRHRLVPAWPINRLRNAS